MLRAYPSANFRTFFGLVSTTFSRFSSLLAVSSLGSFSVSYLRFCCFLLPAFLGTCCLLSCEMASIWLFSACCLFKRSVTEKATL